MSAITLLAHGSYSAQATEPPAELRPLLLAEGNIRQRRINRFTQMALLGAVRCIKRSPVALASECGVYLASGSGQINDSCEVLEQIVAHREEPMPFTFLNVSSNMAGFMVAQSFGLQGRNCAISRNGTAFEAALEMALLDIAVGAVPQALVGVVEECGLPLWQQRQRLRVSTDTPLAEESLWLLLGFGGRRQVEIGRRYRSFADVQEALTQLPQAAHYLATLGPLLSEQQRIELQALLPHVNEVGNNGVSESHALFDFIEQMDGNESAPLLYLNGDESSGYTLFCVSGVAST